ncbi:MAG: hypothetical protein HKP59_11240 [Lutibacter sp.]|uniref:hypothetical protein n=1 Tax=Lutibacter sp. TaxID=1925666 RepID=UPI0017C490A7|nr:hypothetical protein [Lutibacter sp.]MBT8318186.1 hypothetical protein [Lutibacter sp.]NNJ59046.1 hypothetical protein [Lutibacter sp.]
MKKFKLMALVFIIGTASLFATNTNELTTVNKELRNQIVSLLQSPDFYVEKDAVINITFTFSSQGEIVVLKVGCDNCDVLNYVRKNLNHKKIENPGVANRVYTLPLKVKAV